MSEREDKSCQMLRIKIVTTPLILIVSICKINMPQPHIIQYIISVNARHIGHHKTRILYFEEPHLGKIKTRKTSQSISVNKYLHQHLLSPGI